MDLLWINPQQIRLVEFGLYLTHSKSTPLINRPQHDVCSFFSYDITRPLKRNTHHPPPVVISSTRCFVTFVISFQDLTRTVTLLSLYIVMSRSPI